MRRFALLLLACALPAAAQTTTTYTGTIKDLTGAVVTSGRITFTLKPPGVSNISGAGSFVSSTVSCLINGTGNPVSSSDGVSPCVVTNNTSLSPTGTYYNLCIQPYNSAPGSCINAFATGGSVDLSTLVPTPQTQPSFGVASTALANTWNKLQTFSSGISVSNGVSADSVTASGNVGGATASATGTGTFGSVSTPLVNGLVFADAMTGADIGAKINAAVSYCQTNFSHPCTIFVAASGTISTAPVLPMGYTLNFAPQGSYTLSTEWMIQHRGVSVYGNHAKFYYTLDNGLPAIFVGKGIAATVNISGTSVTWVSGTNFSAVDSGDQICWTGPTCANVATVNSNTSITLTGSAGTATGVSANFGMIPNFGLALPNTGAAPLLQDIDIIGTAAETNVNDVGVQVEGVAGMTIRGLTVTDLVSGRCLLIAGSLVGHFYDVHCNVDGGGVQVDQNTLGPVVTGSNANQFFGLSLYAGGTANWNGLTIQNSSGGNDIYGFYAEGTTYHYTVYENNGGSYIQIADWERNAPSSNVDFYASGAGGVITGPAAVEGGATTGFSILAGSTLVLRDMLLAGTYTTPISTASGTTVRMVNVSNSSTGTYSLATGTVTQEDPAGNYTVNLVNSRTGYQVNGVALASTNLSDSSSLVRTIASGTSAMGTSAITAGACATVVTTAAANVLTTDSIEWSFNAAPGTGWPGLTVQTYPTAGNVNFLVCNPTAGSLTPAAVTLNWKVKR